MRTVPSLPGRVRLFAAALVLPALCVVLTRIAPAHGADAAPAPRTAGTPLAPDAKALTAAELDQALIKEVEDNAELMKNLQHLSDVIGPRLTGSKNLLRANEWAAAKMKEYGLENVRQEGWEIPVGWERGTASMKVVEPDTGVRLTVAAWAWTPGIPAGKVTGEVVILRARTKDDLNSYKGKLKNAIIITSSPPRVNPITDLSYGQIGAPAKKDEPKKDEPQPDEPYFPVADDAEQPGKDDPKKEQPPKKDLPPVGVGFGISTAELNAFLKEEGAACTVFASNKPHGLLTMSGSWQGRDRGAPQEGLARLVMSAESFSLLFRLASRPAPAVTKVEVEVTNKFVPGPIECFNTVGEVRGSEKPDEFVVVGAHLDSWDLGTGTTDNGTGSCVVLETARTVAALAKRGYPPRRTIRFVLFTGEEQGLHGSRQYVIRHDNELAKTSVALVHDTGTGKVLGFGLHGREAIKTILDPELTSLASVEGWRGLEMRGLNGSDHQAFHPKGVPGFACLQEVDEYRLTHHTQTDTFDHAKGPNLIQGAKVMTVMCVRCANLPELLPRVSIPTRKGPRTDDKKDDKKDAKKD